MKKSFGKALALAMALCLVLSMLPMAVYAAELPTDFVNGDFEAEVVEGKVPGWTFSKTSGTDVGSVVTDETTGNTYASLKNSGSNMQTLHNQQNAIAVEEGGEYFLTFDYKCSGIGNFEIALYPQYSRFYPDNTNGEWKRYQKRYTVPSGRTSQYIIVRLQAGNTEVCLDNFKLIKIEEGMTFEPSAQWDILVGKTSGGYAPSGTGGDFMKDNGYAVYKKLITSFDSLYHIPYASGEADPFASRCGITAGMIENGTLKFTNTTGTAQTITIVQPYSANMFAQVPIALAVDFKVDELAEGATFTVGMKDSKDVTNATLNSGYTAATFSKDAANDAANGKGYWRQAMTYDLSGGGGRGLSNGSMYLTLTLSGNGTVYVDNFYFISAPNIVLLNLDFEYLESDTKPAVWEKIRTTMVGNYTFHETEENNYIEIASGKSVPVSYDQGTVAANINAFYNASLSVTGFSQKYFLPGQFKLSVDEMLAEGEASGAGICFNTGKMVSTGTGNTYTQAASATEWTTKSMNVLYTDTAEVGNAKLDITSLDANYYLDNIKLEKIEDGCKVYKDGAEVTGTLPAGNLTIEYIKALTKTEGEDTEPINYFTATNGNLIKYHYPSNSVDISRSEDGGDTWLKTNINAALLNGATANGEEASVVTAVYRYEDGARVLDQIVTTVAAGAKFVAPAADATEGITNVGILPTLASHDITLAAGTDYEVQTMIWDGISTMKPINMYSFTTVEAAE